MLLYSINNWKELNSILNYITFLKHVKITGKKLTQKEKTPYDAILDLAEKWLRGVPRGLSVTHSTSFHLV